MAALASVYDEVNSDTTHTGDTNWTTVLTMASADFVADAVYILFVQAIVGGDDTTNLFHYRVAHGSTPTVFDEAEAIWEMSSASDRRRQEYFYMIQYTASNPVEDIVFQHKTAVSTSTVKSAHVIALALRLDADLTEGTDYKYAENSTVDAHTTAQQTGASITFTPANTNDDWLVINSNTIGIGATSGSLPTYRINRDSASDVAPSYTAEGEDTTEVRIQGQQRVYTLTAAAHTFDVEYIDLSPAKNDHNRSAIFALRLDAFEDHDFVWNEAEFTFTIGDEQWEEINGIPTYTPTTAGDNILMAHAVIDENVAGGGTLRIQVGGTTEPTDDAIIPGGSLVFQKARRYDDRDEQPLTCMALLNMAASAQDIDLDGWVTIIASQNIEDRSLVVFSLELAGGGAGSASPAAIARSFTVDAVTQTGPGNITPATTARSFTVDAVTLLGQTSVRPAAIVRSFTVDAPTIQGPGNITPATTARLFTVDLPTLTGPGNTTPATIARLFTVDAVTLLGQTTVRPAVIARAFTIDAVSLTGPGNVTPGAIARLFTVDDVTTDGGGGAGDASPAAIIRAFTVDAVNLTGPGNITPSAIVRVFTVDLVTLLGQTSVRPATIARVFTVDAVTVSGPGNITPGAIVRVFVLPSVTTSESGGGAVPAFRLFIQDPGVW